MLFVLQISHNYEVVFITQEEILRVLQYLKSCVYVYAFLEINHP